MGHALFITYAGWGHVRPQLHYALNLLAAFPNGVATVLTHSSIAPGLQRELDTHYPEQQPNGLYAPSDASANGNAGRSIRDRIQIIPFSENAEAANWDIRTVDNGIADLLDGWEKILPPFIEDLVAGKREVQGMENKFLEKVSVVVNDLFNYPLPDVVKKIAKGQGRDVPLVSFFPVTAAFIGRLFANEEKAMIAQKVATDPSQAPPHPKDVTDEMIAAAFYARRSAAKLLKCEGETFYDYEFQPMAAVCPFPPNMIRSGMYVAANFASDNMQELVIPWIEELEPIEVVGVRKWLKQTYTMVGPQYPESYWRRESPNRTFRGEDQRVMDYLDQMQREHGDRSVAYFSLGSTWFPFGKPEIITYILESLSQAGIPWIYTYASSTWKCIPTDVQSLLDQKKGLAVRHAPQWEVLLHPATRFHLSHCGGNSAAEAILAGLPVVSIPFGADQIDITHMFQRHGCVIPLDQMHCFSNPARNNKLYNGTVIHGTREAIMEEAAEVWAKMMDEGKYESMRRNINGLRQVFVKSREDGLGRKGMMSFGKYLE